MATVNSTLAYGDGTQPMAEDGTPCGGGAEVEPQEDSGARELNASRTLAMPAVKVEGTSAGPVGRGHEGRPERGTRKQLGMHMHRDGLNLTGL